MRLQNFRLHGKSGILKNMKKASVYIETSIVSYLAARPSRDLMIAACQQITTQWWDLSRHSYDVVTSALTIAESREGDSLWTMISYLKFGGIATNWRADTITTLNGWRRLFGR